MRRYPAYRLRLPPKRIFFHSTTVDFVEERREQLDVYLRTLLADPNLCSALPFLFVLPYAVPITFAALLVPACFVCSAHCIGVFAAEFKLAISFSMSSKSIAGWSVHCAAGTKDVWEFLSAWSEVYGTEENTSLLKAMGHSLDAARTNVRRFAGDVGKVRSVSGTLTLVLSPCLSHCNELPHI